METNLRTEENRASGLGDLYAYEIFLDADDGLQLGFLFASGATIIARFKKLLFRRRRLNPRFKSNAIFS